MPYQPYDQLPQVMGAADVLLALLEASAGEFSVPGKVLSHLCAQRPQVAAVPLVNRAAKVIQESGGGYAIPVGDDRGVHRRCTAARGRRKSEAGNGPAGARICRDGVRHSQDRQAI